MATDILIVDDERDIRSLVSMTLEDEGYATNQAAGAAEARNLLLSEPPKLAILDIWMRESDMDGLELLEWSKSIYPDLPILMISGHGTIETAVQAIRNGAYDFIEKPFKEERLLMMVSRALESAKLTRENNELKARIIDGATPELIGKSPVIRGIRQSIDKIAPTASRVLVNGPSGSGKELAARCILINQTEKTNVLLSQIARGWHLNGWIRNYLVQKVCKATAGSSGFLNRRIKERYILTKYAICQWKPREKLYGR